MDKKGRCLQCQHFFSYRGCLALAESRGACYRICKEMRITIEEGGKWLYPDAAQVSELFRCIYYRKRKIK